MSKSSLRRVAGISTRSSLSTHHFESCYGQTNKKSYLEYANRQARDRRLVRQIEPAGDDEEPGDVRGRSRQRLDDLATVSWLASVMNENGNRPSPECLLAKLKAAERARLRVYIGAAPGVGKTYQMLEDAHLLKRQGVDIVVAVVEAHGREETQAMIGDLERLPLRHINYRSATFPDQRIANASKTCWIC